MERTAAQSVAAAGQQARAVTRPADLPASPTPTPSPSHSAAAVPNGSTKAPAAAKPKKVQGDTAPPSPNKAPVSHPGSGKNSKPTSNANSPKSSPAKSRSRSRSKKEAQPAPLDVTPDDTKVEVTGYPTYSKSPDLYKIFARYGTATVEYMGRKSAVVAFEDAQSARDAIADSLQLCLYGQFLVIKPFSGILEDQRKQIYKSKHTVVTVPPESIPLTGSFGEQVGALLAAVRLTQEQVTALATLYGDLERVLQPIWPGCQAMPFGSITTGLGVKSSDADCFMNIPPQFRYGYYNFVNKAKRVLQAYPETFAEVFAIPRANTPIVKLFHLPTKTHCDLTFKTPLGALNSKLVAFLLHADPRFLPLAVLVKYWASVQGVSGSGKLTNYALTLMLIFYLQSVGALPAVAALQRGAVPVVVDGWNTGFVENYDKIPRRTDDGALQDLLGGFFKFYDAFDFENLVACPLLGRPVPKALFLEGELPPEFQRYRQNVADGLAAPLRVKSPVCVQDPFEQCHNVASSVSPRMYEDIRAYLRFAAEHYDKDAPNGCVNLLRSVLLDRPKLVRAKNTPEYRVTLYPKMLSTIVHDDWTAAVRRTVFTIFERMLRLKLTPVGEKEAARHARQREVYATSLNRPLWKRRHPARSPEPEPMDFVARQERITQEITASEPAVPNVNFQVVLSFGLKVRNVWFSVRLVDGDADSFYPLGKFLLAMMHGWVINVLHATGETTCRPPRALREGDGPDSEDDSEDVSEGRSVAEPEGVSETREAAEPEGVSEGREAAEPKGDSECREAAKPKDVSECRAAAEPENVLEGREPAETEGVSEGREAAEMEGVSEGRGTVEPEDAGRPPIPDC